MIKKIIVFILLLFLTGCYNYNELNDLAIVVAMGIDKVDSEYVISLEVVNTQKSSEEKNSKFTIYQAKGDTIEQAVKNISYVCPKKIYLSHLEVIIYGENIAKLGIKNSLDYLARNIEIRGDTIMLIAKNSRALDILETKTPIDAINARNIASLIKTSHSTLGKSVYITFDDVLSTFLNNNKEIIIPSITLETSKSTKKTSLKIADTAIFKNDKLIGFLNSKDTLGYNILTNNINETIIKYQDKNNYIEALINKINTKITVKDNLNINISIKASGNISETNENINLENDKVIDSINKKIAKEIKKIVTNSLKAITTLNSDIIGLLDNYYKNNYHSYQKINHNWYQNMKKIKYHINVDVNLINKGKTLKVIKDEK